MQGRRLSVFDEILLFEPSGLPTAGGRGVVGYELRAVIADRVVLTVATAGQEQARVVPLGQEMALVPMTDVLFDAVSDGTTAHEMGFWFLPGGFERVLSVWSGTGPVAYVEAEYFGMRWCPVRGLRSLVHFGCSVWSPIMAWTSSTPSDCGVTGTWRTGPEGHSTRNGGYRTGHRRPCRRSRSLAWGRPRAQRSACVLIRHPPCRIASSSDHLSRITSSASWCCMATNTVCSHG
jgi:hypothetical protein